MQYAIYPFKTMRETQKIGGLFSHKGTYALDEGGKDTGIDNLYAPCDLKVVAKGSSSYNAVYYQSVSKVKFANGIEDYINFRTLHDNDISNIKVGQVFKQFSVIGQEGKRGATGSHTHLQVAKGVYRGIYKNIYGFYMLVNEIAPNKVFSLLKGYNKVLKTSASWNWVTGSTYTIAKKKLITLRIGSKGELVTYLQKRLVEKGYQLKVDGKFGKITLSNVKAFQKHNGLTVDGIVGNKTFTALIK